MGKLAPSDIIQVRMFAINLAKDSLTVAKTDGSCEAIPTETLLTASKEIEAYLLANINEDDKPEGPAN